MKKFLRFITSREFWLNKWTIGILSIVIIFSMMSFAYIKNPRLFPQFVKSANKSLIDRILGKELAEKIDATRDENGATSIRLIFNDNKEENLARHCEKKEVQGKIQEKCYKVYENEELGFSFMYPEDWVVEKRGSFVFLNKKEDVGIDGETSSILFNTYENPKDYSLTQWVDVNKELFIGDQDPNNVPGFLERKAINVAGYEALEFSFESMGTIKDTVVKKDDKIILIEIDFPGLLDENNEYYQTYNTLLKTTSF